MSLNFELSLFALMEARFALNGHSSQTDLSLTPGEKQGTEKPLLLLRCFVCFFLMPPRVLELGGVAPPSALSFPL
jgi:hypothetical protein